MYSLYASDDNISYGIKKFILDTEEDINMLPKNIQSGSSALVMNNSQLYILNNEKKWIKLNNSIPTDIKTFLEWEIF